MQLLLAVCLALLGGATACQKFFEGTYCKTNCPTWNWEEASPACLDKYNSYPYSGQSRTYQGYFNKVPSGTPSNYQDQLDNVMAFKWYCLTTCVDTYGTAQTLNPIGLAQGNPFTDSPLPELVTLRCVCNSAAFTDTITMRQLNDKWKAECHFSSTTTTSLPTTTSTATTTTTTTEAPKVFVGVDKIGCFEHMTANPRLMTMPEFTSPPGFMKLAPNSPAQCGSRCFTINQEYVFSGVTGELGNECWCGTQANQPSIQWWSAITVKTDLEGACDAYANNGKPGSGIVCADVSGKPAWHATDMIPRPGFEWCGGNQRMMVYAVHSKPTSFPL